jgi:hypothetical protein
VNVRPWPHSDTRIWAPSSWSQRILRVLTWGLSGASVKQQGSHDLTWFTKGHQDLGASGPAWSRAQVQSNLIYLGRGSEKEEGDDDDDDDNEELQ